MLDKLHLFVPFRLEHITLLGAEGRSEPVHYVDINGLGIPLQGQVQQRDDGGFDVEHLRHAWESLSTGFTPLAFKVFHESLGKRLMPGVEIKASPAKLLQGHNVFGPTCIQKGAEVMLKWLAGSYPKLFSMLDVHETQVYCLDCTYSARLPNERTALQVIAALRGTSNGNTKPRGDTYETTAYWGKKDSRLKRLKAYLKYPEFLRQLEEAKRNRVGRTDPEPRRDLHNAHVREWKRLDHPDLSAYRTLKVLSNPNLQEWAKNLLRFEATVMHRWLERRGLSTRLVDLIAYQQKLQEEGRCFIQECWQAVI